MGWITAIAFALISAILAARLLSLKGHLRNMAGQIKTLVDDNSEKMLDISLYDQDLERLAGAFNRYHAKQRGVVAQSLRHEDQLKESISNISHDLRTPLTVIMGHLQLLEKVDLPDNQKWRVEVSLRKSQRMAALVEAFYELSVLDSEQIIPHKERLNFSNLLFDLLAENASLLESRGIHPKIHMPDTTVFIISDRRMILRILDNLLTNAIRYTSGNIEINVSGPEDNHVQFCIRNQTYNAKELDVERIFERFYTKNPARTNGSTGLGLAVVKKLTEMLGGEVSATVQSDFLSLTVTI